jgi:tRNA threonylcarbamoyladenosine biosynthesis protein TsaE
MTEFPVSLIQYQITTRSAGETRRLAEFLGTLIVAPIVIAMTGDLGSGKTTFVQGLARGLRVAKAYPITSPTFTLVNEYPGRLPLYHVDLYRITNPLDVEELGLYDIMRGEGVVIIEWAAIIADALPLERLDIGLEIVDDDLRKLTFIGYGSDSNNLLSRIEHWNEEQR